MRTLLIALLALCLPIPSPAAPPKASLISVKKIWDQAPHSAFTDLVYWKGQFVCAFREGRSHVSTDGQIRVLTSPDGENWASAAVLTLPGYDLRDAGLSVAPGNRLMLNGGAAPRKKDHESAPTGTFVAFSDDAKTWSTPRNSPRSPELALAGKLARRQVLWRFVRGQQPEPAHGQRRWPQILRARS